VAPGAYPHPMPCILIVALLVVIPRITHGQVIEELYERFANGEVIAKDRYSFFHDERGNTIRTTTHRWEQDAWVEISRNYREYDDKNRPVLWHYETLGEEGWTTGHRREVTWYSHDDRATAYTVQLRSGQEWVNFYQNVLIKDDRGRNLNSGRKYWSNGRWIYGTIQGPYREMSSYRTHWQYEDQQWTVTNQAWDNGWSNRSRSISDKDENGISVASLTLRWEENQWHNQRRWIRSYPVTPSDTTGITTYFDWEGSSWSLSQRSIQLTSEDGNRSESIREYWTDSTWTPTNRSIVLRGPFGIESITTEDWIDDGWRGSIRYETIYDGEGNEIEVTKLNYFDSLWLLESRRSYRYASVSSTNDPSIPSPPVLNVYPNPSQGWVNVELGRSSEPPITIQIVDALGRVVADVPPELSVQSAGRLRISTHEFSSGIYFVRVVRGDRVHIRSFVAL